MSLVRWEPFGSVETLFNRMMPSAFAGWPRLALEGNGGKVEWAPSADISETEKEYVIRAELPAVKKEDVQVTFEDGMITIKGERKQQKEDKNEKYHRVESFHGSFVVVRVSPEFTLELHLDSDEGNAAGLQSGAEVSLAEVY
jgi:HSP20 family protein